MYKVHFLDVIIIERQEINQYIMIKSQIPSIILVTFNNNSSASIKLVSIT